MDQTIEEIKKDKVLIIPSDFTYWVHNTQYKPLENCSNPSEIRRCWHEIPTDNFVVKSEMSFVTKLQRIQSAVDYNTAPSTNYARTSGSVGFQIRVLQPRQNAINEYYKDDEKSKRHFWYRGLGDGRHPKIPSKTNIIILGASICDEASGENFPILYGICEQDVPVYLNALIKNEKTLLDNNNYSSNNLTVQDRYVTEEAIPVVLDKGVDVEYLTNLINEQYKTLETTK